MSNTYHRTEAQQYVREMLTGHHKDATHNMYNDTRKALDDIYDDIDARLCENCKAYAPQAGHCVTLDKYFEQDFGCNKFERKDDVKG